MNNHREVTTRFNREKFKGKETFSPFRIVGKYVKDEKIEHVMYLHPIQNLSLNRNKAQKKSISNSRESFNKKTINYENCAK